VRKLALIMVWLVENPEAYEGKTNAGIEKEILEETEIIPYAARIEKVNVLDVCEATPRRARSRAEETAQGKVEARK